MGGDSAGRSAKQGRDRKFQAILPLKGKILNVEKARFDKMLSSVEVGTLITALGCGIGREEFNLNKLRYHRIIIMTDADVDGSHIRTLLLTFFYRQMPELIENGYVYIAQPPLYKVKKGKQERYVKDDAELNTYLLQVALENTEFYVNEHAPALSGEALEVLAKQYILVMESIQRLARRYPIRVLEKMIAMPVFEDEALLNKDRARGWFDNLQQMLNADDQAQDVIEIRLEDDESEAGAWQAQLITTRFGLDSERSLRREFFESGEYQAFKTLIQQLQGLIGDGAYVQRGERRKDVGTFKEVMEWLMEEARRGQHIQRYKGLGEMNPEQLWETTLDANSRRLLQVQIEDAIGADEIFTTLMGDQVEPRRDFIESNALNASNLDV